MDNPVIIFGAKGQAINALEIFQSNEHLIYCFLDDDIKMHGKEIHNIAVMGATDDDGFLKLVGKKCDAFVAIENTKQRQFISEMLFEKRKVMPVNAIHKMAYVSSLAEIGHGNLVCAGVAISADAKIGSHCVFNINSSIDTNVVIDDFVQIGAGSVINSGTKIDQGVFVGSGVTIIGGITIGKNARIGAGSVVMANVIAGQTVFGVPAVQIKN